MSNRKPLYCAVRESPADDVVGLEHRDAHVAVLREQVGRRQTRGTGADDDDAIARFQLCDRSSSGNVITHSVSGAPTEVGVRPSGWRYTARVEPPRRRIFRRFRADPGASRGMALENDATLSRSNRRKSAFAGTFVSDSSGSPRPAAGKDQRESGGPNGPVLRRMVGLLLCSGPCSPRRRVRREPRRPSSSRSTEICSTSSRACGPRGARCPTRRSSSRPTARSTTAGRSPNPARPG